MWIRWIIILTLLIVAFCSVRPVHAATSKPIDDTVGTLGHYTLRENDNLYDVARRFDLGIVALLAANPGIDAWQPKAGTVLILPQFHVLPPQRHGIVLNLSELRLYYFRADGSVMYFPVGIGREGWPTPTGTTSIIKKRKDPVWIPPLALREENPNLPDIVPAGPDNPLGLFAMNLGWPSYRIHGTNRPAGVGKRSSHGCIRLYPEDIAALFEMVDVGTNVTVIDTAYKLGWKKNQLLLEVTPTQDQIDAIAAYHNPPSADLPQLYDDVKAIAGTAEVDWYRVEQAANDHRGIPVVIAHH